MGSAESTLVRVVFARQRSRELVDEAVAVISSCESVCDWSAKCDPAGGAMHGAR